MASIREVAKRAGVSISTVSRVISKKIPVDEDTQEIVKKAIRELKYKPDLIASGLRSKSAKSIGLLVPRISDPFFTALIDHVDQCVISRGYNLLLFNTHSDPAFEEQVLDNLLRRHVDGIIFSLVSDESSAMELLTGVDVPVVMLDRVREDAKLMNLVLDNREAGEIAAEHLLSLGHRRIACLTGPQKIHLCMDRLSGFAETLARRGGKLDATRIFQGDFTFNSGMNAVQHILRVNGGVTAVWAQNDLMAAGLQSGLARSGVRVPEEMSIIGMDDLLISEITIPTLTTVAQPVKEMAEKAVDMIFKTKDKIGIKRKVLLHPRLVIRESTARNTTA